MRCGWSVKISHQIYALRKAGHSQKEIAEVLRRNPSTISRELGRNKGLKGYRPEQAHRLAQNRKKERDRDADTGINLGTCGAVASGGLEPGADQFYTLGCR